MLRWHHAEGGVGHRRWRPPLALASREIGNYYSCGFLLGTAIGLERLSHLAPAMCGVFAGVSVE